MQLWPRHRVRFGLPFFFSSRYITGYYVVRMMIEQKSLDLQRGNLWWSQLCGVTTHALLPPPYCSSIIGVFLFTTYIALTVFFYFFVLHFVANKWSGVLARICYGSRILD